MAQLSSYSLLLQLISLGVVFIALFGVQSCSIFLDPLRIDEYSLAEAFPR